MELWGWMSDLVATYGYLGAFLISLFGNFTVFFPVPFAVTIYAFGAKLNPALLGLVSAVGSTVGEISAYLIGRGGRKVIDQRYGDKLDAAKALVETYGVWVIFLFAVLPLPDDLILIPLGIIRFPVRKAVAAMFAGKLVMCTLLAYAGKYSYTAVKKMFETSGWMGGVASTLLLALIVVALLKVDWIKILESQKSKTR